MPVEELRQFDASFSTSMVYGVATTDLGFTLVEQELADPFTKRYTLLDDLEDEQLPWDVLILARSADELVGVAATSFAAWNRRQVLSELHVASSHRRQGVGRSLFDRVRTVAKQNEAREIWLETQSHNLPAIKAYQRLGFRLTGIDMTRYAAPFETEIAVFMSQRV